MSDMVEVGGGNLTEKATYSWRICSELQCGETIVLCRMLQKHFYGVTGTCLALLHTEGSALRHTGRNGYQRQHPLLELAEVEMVVSW